MEINLSTIIDKCLTKGKQENFKKYIERLESRNFNKIIFYEGYISIKDLCFFIRKYELSIESQTELIYWIKIYFDSWIKGLNNRLKICEDFLLIKHIVTDEINIIKNNGYINYKKTIEFVKTIDINALKELLVLEFPLLEDNDLTKETT